MTVRHGHGRRLPADSGKRHAPGQARRVSGKRLRALDRSCERLSDIFRKTKAEMLHKLHHPPRPRAEGAGWTLADRRPYSRRQTLNHYVSHLTEAKATGSAPDRPQFRL